MLEILLLFHFVAIGSVIAKAIDFNVGKGASLTFAPNTITADLGDTLNFHFYNGLGGHGVVSGPFSNPCEPGRDSFFSGYVKGDLMGDMSFIVTVNSTDPIWFYCSLAAHCIAGMVGTSIIGSTTDTPTRTFETTFSTETASLVGTSISRSATTTKATRTNGGVAATSTPSGGGKSNDASIILGLGVLGGVFVALMS